MVFSLSGCQGNYASIDFKEAIPISENGIVNSDIVKQIKSNQEIANFVGEYNQYKYEWIIFGSDVSDVKDINLSLVIKENSDDEIELTFAEESSFPFPMFLSIELDKKWDAQHAKIYKENNLVDSVSVTGSQNTILNVNVQDLQGTYVIRAEKQIAEATVAEKLEQDTEILTDVSVEEQNLVSQENVKKENDNYLAQVKESSEEVYLSDVNSDSKVVFVPSENDTEVAYRMESPEKDSYLSGAKSSSNRVYSSGRNTGKDKYETDPIPAGKPMPVEPEDQKINKETTYTCTFSIECSTILNNIGDLNPNKRELLPANGVILSPTQVTFYEGESVYDVLKRVCQEKGIHMESSWTPIYNSAYVEGIHNLYEFDCGELSGWMYRVNGWYPNYGSSRYQLAQGEVVEWRYTCDLGRDVNCEWMGNTYE